MPPESAGDHAVTGGDVMPTELREPAWRHVRNTRAEARMWSALVVVTTHSRMDRFPIGRKSRGPFERGARPDHVLLLPARSVGFEIELTSST
jgi:hypothetical protein